MSQMDYERRPIPSMGAGWEADTNGRIWLDGEDITDRAEEFGLSMEPDPNIVYLNGGTTDCRPANIRWRTLDDPPPPGAHYRPNRAERRRKYKR
jgi:hypothetical protein